MPVEPVLRLVGEEDCRVPEAAAGTLPRIAAALGLRGGSGRVGVGCSRQVSCDGGRLLAK